MAIKNEPTNKALYARVKAEAKKKADEVYEKLKAGEAFAGLAQTYSEDRGSAGKGGVLP